MADFIQFDTQQMMKSTSEMLKELQGLDDALRNEIMDDALSKGAMILLDEQRRILRQHPNPHIKNFSSFVQIWGKTKGRYKQTMFIGYPSDLLRQNLKYVYVEFGRRGGRRDKLGRKIGEVQPYSHIRAAKFLKKEEVNETIAKTVNSEIERRWK